MPATDAPHSPVNPQVRYEHTDISAIKVLFTGVGILLGTWAIVAMLYLFYSSLVNERMATTLAPPVRAAGRTLEPPQPRLETSPTRDLVALRAAEDKQLNGYSWADKQKGVVSIPIERAMELIAQRGIPPQKDWSKLNLPIPQAGTRETGFEGQVEPEPR
jgi:hypothetical protein